MFALRVGGVFEAEAALRVGAAHVKHGGEAFGAAVGIGLLQNFGGGLRAQFGRFMQLPVPAAHLQSQVGAGFGHFPALINGLHQRHAGFFVAVVCGQDFGCGGGFAQIVQQRGVAFGQAQAGIGGALQGEQGVDAAVDFGVVVCALRHAEQGFHFGQQHGERAALAQHFNHAHRPRFHQPARKLLPHALGHQRIGFAALHHIRHQAQGFGGYLKTVAGGKPRSAQNPYWVFGEGGGNVAQYACGQIGLPAERVDNLPGRIMRHGVDGEVAPLQVLLQGNVRLGVESEAGIAAPGFAFGARQGVFFMRFGVQEHRKILAHRLIARREHGRRIGAHHNPIAVFHFPPQQGIAYRAAHQINLHLPFSYLQFVQTESCPICPVLPKPPTQAT